jgi:hypothetical protein
MGSPVRDYRPMSRTPRQRYKRKLRDTEAVEPVIAAQAQSANEPAPYVPSPAFAAAYASPHNEIGPILTRWNERGIAEWLLPTNTGSSNRPTPARNF